MKYGFGFLLFSGSANALSPESCSIMMQGYHSLLTTHSYHIANEYLDFTAMFCFQHVNNKTPSSIEFKQLLGTNSDIAYRNLSQAVDKLGL